LPAAGNPDDFVAEGECRRFEPGFLVAEDQRYRAVTGRVHRRRPSSERGADDTIGVPQRAEGCGERRTVQRQVFQPAFRHAISRIRGHRLVETVGQHDSYEAKESGGAGDGTEVLGVTDPVQNQKRLAVLRPNPDRRRVEIDEGTPAGDGDRATMQHGAGDPR
jgi:hypothetical protein